MAFKNPNLSYLTVDKEAAGVYIEKKSKFVSSISPVKSEEDARDFVNKVKSKNYNARHNVYAYRVFDKILHEKSSDDGEPSGTGGRPALETLKNFEIINAAVVITRYFGGILLGTAGLTRAYGKSTAESIKAAGIIKKLLCKKVAIISEYNLSGKTEWLIRDLKLKSESPIYGEKVEFNVFIPVDRLDEIIDGLNDVTGAGVKIIKKENLYVGFREV